MYAIVEIAGQQFKVAKDQKVYVHRLQEKEGAKVTFNKVMQTRFCIIVCRNPEGNPQMYF